VPTGPIDVPLLMAQGQSDPIVPADRQQVYVDGRCAGGGILEYRTYDGFEHVDLVEADSPLIPYLVEWTQGRFDGEEAVSTC